MSESQLLKSVKTWIISGVVSMLLLGAVTLMSLFFTLKIKDQYNDKDHLEFSKNINNVSKDINSIDKRVSIIEANK
jgi:hypothetical protein